MAKFDWRYITIGILRLVQSYDVILLKYYSQNELQRKNMKSSSCYENHNCDSILSVLNDKKSDCDSNAC